MIEMARVREVKRYVCNRCEEGLTKCDLCSHFYITDEKIECKGDGMKHICEKCMG